MVNAENWKTRILLCGVVICIGSLVALKLGAQDRNTDDPTPTVTQWQHLALTHSLGDTPKSELASKINRLGREGWELVSVENITKTGTTTKTIFYFKRPH